MRDTPGWIVGLATGGWSGAAKVNLRHAGIDFEGLPLASADDAEAREPRPALDAAIAFSLHSDVTGAAPHFTTRFHVSGPLSA